MDKVWEKIVSLKPDYQLLPFNEVFAKKMNNLYKTICYYNLQEKFLCGGISLSEWSKIEENYGNK